MTESLISELVHQRSQPPTIADVSRLTRSDRRACILKSTPGVDGDLPQLQLDVLWTLMQKPAALERLAVRFQPRILNATGTQATNLEWTAQLRRLEWLALSWNTKASDFGFIERCRALERLYLSDFKKVNSLYPLRCQRSLRALVVSGGIWNVMKIESFEPLAELMSLEELSLYSMRLDDQSLQPLHALTSLRRLKLASNLAPMEEYARLAAALPNTACEMFNGYIIANGTVPSGADPVAYLDELDDREVIMVGHRAPSLRARTDRKEIMRRLQRFLATRDSA